jgi:hypothetical protein
VTSWWIPATRPAWLGCPAGPPAGETPSPAAQKEIPAGWPQVAFGLYALRSPWDPAAGFDAVRRLPERLAVVRKASKRNHPAALAF